MDRMKRKSLFGGAAAEETPSLLLLRLLRKLMPRPRQSRRRRLAIDSSERRLERCHCRCQRPLQL